MSDSYPAVISMEDACLEVKGKYITKGAVSVDIGANPSAEGGDDDGAVHHYRARHRTRALEISGRRA